MGLLMESHINFEEDFSVMFFDRTKKMMIENVTIISWRFFELKGHFSMSLIMIQASSM